MAKSYSLIVRKVFPNFGGYKPFVTDEDVHKRLFTIPPEAYLWILK